VADHLTISEGGLRIDSMQSQHLQRLRLVNSAIGFVLCGFAASLLAILFWNSHRYQILEPILFTFVVVAVAIRFGRVVGILGTLFGAALFAIWLYPPFGSLRVSSQQALGSLHALLLGGLVLSYLLGTA
jgi:K+-sensing histidine kinase KdpD